MNKTFVGFGFGPIQSALFLYEAYRSGNFSRYVVAEIDANLVRAIRDNGGIYTINIAHPDRIEQVDIKGVELYDPRDEADRHKVLAAIASADEMATALPSVKFFDSGNEASVATLLAMGISRRKESHPALIYAAENHNHAAEILADAVQKHAQDGVLFNVQFANTVIGKMSGVISDPEEIRRLGLTPMTPATGKAILVEVFNRILISKITMPGFTRGIEVFSEKPDLLPFEEAKLYGHNAIHALIGYLSQIKGLTTMAEAAHHPEILATARAAFVDESGIALQRKYASLNEQVFTPDGFRSYADDLLVRMVNPNLNDLVARVIRDPERKLGYDDRLYGTMRLALSQGVKPINMAKGATAAVRYLATTQNRRITDRADLSTILLGIWGSKVDEYADTLIDLTWQAF